MRRIVLAIFAFTGMTLASAAGPPADKRAVQTMTNQRLQTLIEGVCKDVRGKPGYWRFTLTDFDVTVITDEKADRMRIIVPVAALAEIDADDLMRLMQANFDSALDARYAVAKGIVWSAYIHPLSALSEHEFINGLAQTVNLAATYGSTFSSGVLLFGDGDSKSEQNGRYRENIEPGNAI
jgi:hypothetical protein